MDETKKISGQESGPGKGGSTGRESVTKSPSAGEENQGEGNSKGKSRQVRMKEETDDNSKQKSRLAEIVEEADDTGSKVKSRLQQITEESEDAFDYFNFDAPELEKISEHGSEEEEEQLLEMGPYGIHYEKITQRHLKEIAYELGLIQLTWPEHHLPIDQAKEFPSSYYTNDSKEKLLLLYTENFRRQFHFVYPDRRPLLLAADNEYGLQKMVCTTIRPTRVPYPELSTWEGCARFIADHLQYEPLDKPTLFPERIISPSTVLEQQTGNCFEYSTLLCSYLIGIGYDAYVVSGYATYELCFAEQSGMENPELDKYKPKESPIPEPVKRKYEMKLTKDFDSKYLKTMKERAEAEARAKEEEAANKKDEEGRRPSKDENRLSELPADDFFAVRVHSWVLLCPGTLDVDRVIFIDPPTGRSYYPDDPNFLGLESLWSDTNYWVNLQDCSEGCRNLKFDLKDPTCWIWLLLGEPWYMREKIVEEEEGGEELFEDEDDEEKHGDDERKKLAKYKVEKHLDMPTSWALRPNISYQAYRKRFPEGQKEIIYKRSKVSNYAPYINKDGCIQRIVTYTDSNYETQEIVYEVFEYRADLLTEVIKNFQSESVIEKFSKGREEGLKEHHYFMGFGNVDDKRELTFYSDSRPDGLAKVEMDPLFMTLYYENRLDRLYYRHAKFLPKSKSSEAIMEVKRTVQSLIEKFYRDPSKDNEEDIAERIYVPPDNKIYLKFHYGDNKVVASTREFTKPPLEKLGDKLTFVPEDTVGFNVDPTYPTPRAFVLFDLLKEQLAAEEQAFFDVRSTEEEINLLLKQRAVENTVPKLTVSIYDTERNEEAKLDMLEKEKKMQEQIDKEYDTDIDYLAPYIARLGVNVLSQKDAQVVRDQCLTDHKNLYVARANNLQHAFERTANTLRQKHQWFEENRDTISKEEEDDYFEQCNQLRFYLHTLEIRLKRHRDLVPQKYRALEKWLRNDPRLAVLYY